MAGLMDMLNELIGRQQQKPVNQTAMQGLSNTVVNPDEEIANKLYNSFSTAETGSFDNPWIRTTSAPKQGSTAYGPVQITKTKAKDYVDRGLVSKESAEFYKTVLEPMYNNFNKYGREPNKPGYSKEYDYGGSGNFNTEQFAKQYEKMAKEMLLADFKSSGGDINGTIRRWRGVSDDERYNKSVLDTFK